MGLGSFAPLSLAIATSAYACDEGSKSGDDVEKVGVKMREELVEGFLVVWRLSSPKGESNTKKFTRQSASLKSTRCKPLIYANPLEIVLCCLLAMLIRIHDYVLFIVQSLR